MTAWFFGLSAGAKLGIVVVAIIVGSIFIASITQALTDRKQYQRPTRRDD